MPFSSTLVSSSERLRFVRYDSRIGTGSDYDVYTKVYNTASAGTLKTGENITSNVNRKAILKGLAKAERLTGHLSAGDYEGLIADFNSSLTN